MLATHLSIHNAAVLKMVAQPAVIGVLGVVEVDVLVAADMEVTSRRGGGIKDLEPGGSRQ